MGAAMHPEVTPDPGTLRWRYVDASHTPPTGALQVPAALDSLGIVGLMAQDSQLLTTLDDAEAQSGESAATWRAIGAQVAGELTHMLDAGGWQALTDQRATPLANDARISDAVQHVIDTSVGAIAESHGGQISLVSVEKGVVTVELTGACNGCPAAAVTLHQRLEDAVREQVPGVVEIRSNTPVKQRRGLGPGGRRLLKWAHDQR